MIIARIQNATRVLGQAQGYIGLPVRDERDEQVVFDAEVLDTRISDTVNGPGTHVMVTAWEPTPDELVRLAKGAFVYLRVLGTKHPPVMIEVGYTEETCPGHVASKGDPKVCGRCGVHIDSLRPDNGDGW